MTFDISTLAIARAIVAFLGGCVLLMHWWRDRAVWAAFWWAAVSCGMGVGIAMLAMHDVVPAWVSAALGPLILDLCGALAWVAARIFTRGSVKPLLVIAATGGWQAAGSGIVLAIHLVELRRRPEKKVDLGERAITPSVIARSPCDEAIAGAACCGPWIASLRSQ